MPDAFSFRYHPETKFCVQYYGTILDGGIDTEFDSGYKIINRCLTQPSSFMRGSFSFSKACGRRYTGSQYSYTIANTLDYLACAQL